MSTPDRRAPGGHFVDHSDIARAQAAHRKISLLVQLSRPGDNQGGRVVLTGRIRVPMASCRGN